MPYRIFLIFIWIIVLFSPIIYAEEGGLIIDAAYFKRLGSVRNPFESQLPKEEPREEKKPDVPPQPQPVQPQPMPVAPRPQPTPPPAPPPPPAPRAVEVHPPSFTISGVVWDTSRPQAIINDRVVGIGDVIENTEILGIWPTGIDIRYQGREMTLQFKETK